MPDTHHTAAAGKLSPLKRSSSSAGLPQQKRPIKRRASKACQSCRFRKVRCNVVEHGSPCTNCRLDDVDCVLTESKRKRKSISQYDDVTANNKYTSYNPVQKTRTVLDGMPNLSKKASVARAYKPNPSHHVPHSLYRNITQLDNFQRPDLRATQSEPGHKDVDDGHRLSLSTLVPSPCSPANPPGYLKPVPTRLGAEEREYLQKKGAMIVPDNELRDGLVAAFLEYVYPLNPILDVRDFLVKMNQGDSSRGRFSLLLFQAIMFAGSAYVDIELLRRAGFMSRQEARAKFYMRVRHLYDFDYEMDRFSQVQALLLLTSWYESPEDRKDAWHWMSIVVSTAYTIGMHRDPANAHMDLRQIRLWKRVWWCAIMRDRILSLGMRRPMHIKLDDADVPLLSVQDFELEPFAKIVQPADCLLLRDAEMQRTVAEMCVQATRLCLCIGDAVTAQFSVQATRDNIFAYDMQLFLGHDLNTSLAAVDVCTEGLHAWKDALPEHLSPNVHRDFAEVQSSPSCIVALRSLVQMLYYTTLGTLHRPHVLQSVPTTNMARGTELIQNSRILLQDAAAATGDIAKTLLDLDLVRFLPTTGVTVLQTAIISLLLDIKSSDDTARRRALRGFCYCVQAMGKLRDCYAAADHIIALVEAAIRRADIRVVLPSTSGGRPSEKKANSAADILAAAMHEGLIPDVCMSPSIATLPSDLSDIGRDLSKEAETAAEGRSFLPITPGSAPTQTPAMLRSSDIARRMEAFMMGPLPGPEQSGSSGDYWGFVPADGGIAAGGEAANVGLGSGALGFDFDAFMNDVPGGVGVGVEGGAQGWSDGSESTMVDGVFDGSEKSAWSDRETVSPPAFGENLGLVDIAVL